MELMVFYKVTFLKNTVFPYLFIPEHSFSVNYSHSLSHRDPEPQWELRRNLWPYPHPNLPREPVPGAPRGSALWGEGWGKDGWVLSHRSHGVSAFAPLLCFRKPLAWPLADLKSRVKGMDVGGFWGRSLLTVLGLENNHGAHLPSLAPSDLPPSALSQPPKHQRSQLPVLLCTT